MGYSMAAVVIGMLIATGRWGILISHVNRYEIMAQIRLGMTIPGKGHPGKQVCNQQ